MTLVLMIVVVHHQTALKQSPRETDYYRVLRITLTSFCSNYSRNIKLSNCHLNTHTSDKMAPVCVAKWTLEVT
jgi:hypothetical protein